MNEVSTWKLRAWFHSPRTNCFLSPFIESDFLLKSSSLGNDSEKNCDLLSAMFLGEELSFFRDFTFIVQLPDSRPRLSVKEGLHLLWDVLVCYGCYRVLKFKRLYFATDRHAPGFRSPTVAIRVSARRPPRSGFPLADRRDPSFHSPPPSQRATLGTKPNEVYRTKNILILSARIWFGPSWLFGKIVCKSNTSNACFYICCNVVDLSIKRLSARLTSALYIKLFLSNWSFRY